MDAVMNVDDGVHCWIHLSLMGSLTDSLMNDAAHRVNSGMLW